MGMLSEFKDFAVKGNVIDMAVGIVIGGAFGKIVSSFVGDIVMPAVGMLSGGLDFSKYKIPLSDAVAAVDAVPASDGVEAVAAIEATEGVFMGIGTFANTVIDFVIVAFAIFMVVKALNSAKKKEEKKPAAPAPTPKEQVLLGEIRDLLAKKG